MSKRKEKKFHILRGGLSGLTVGFLFFILLAATDIMPQMLYMRLLYRIKIYESLASLLHISVDGAIYIVHFVTAITIGILFAVFFHKLVKNYMNGLALGCIYGVIWWLITPFYIVPFFFLIPSKEEWHLITSFTLISSFFGHIIFGALIGLFYALFRKR